MYETIRDNSGARTNFTDVWIQSQANIITQLSAKDRKTSNLYNLMRGKTNWSRAQIIAAHRGIMVTRAARVRHEHGEDLGDDRVHYYDTLLRFELVNNSATLTPAIVKANELCRKATQLRQVQRRRMGQKHILRVKSQLPESLINHVLGYVGW